jgi:radical SAM protein with 4Fe4S-binding SPASM domain
MTLNDSESPWIVNLELTNLCQLECVFCDHPVFKKKMRLGCMEDSLLRKILSDIERDWSDEKIHELGLVGLGEPTLDKRWSQHLEIINGYAHRFDRISLNSNLVSLSAKKSQEALDSVVNAFTFSINASNRDHYLEMMGADQFDRVVENFSHFLEALQGVKKDVSVDVQVFDSEKSSVEELIELFPGARDQGINFFSRKVYSKPVIKDGSEVVNLHVPGRDQRYPCWDVYTRIYIDIEGFLYPCTIGNDSFRQESELCLGNVQQTSVKDIFNGERNHKARELFENGKLGYPECKDCNIWSLTPNNFDWSDEESKWQRKVQHLRAYGLKT